MKYSVHCLLLYCLFLASCKELLVDTGSPGFSKIDSLVSGVNFSNTIVESDSFNYYTFPYLYMGGGIAVGDINNDGLQDLFFTGNMVPNRLYLNKGNFQFEDISQSAAVAGDNRWYTGVTMADVNNDGWLDIYLSVLSGSDKTQKPANQLYINNQDQTFSEQAEAYGLDDQSASIQATFFDFDNDGYLDVFVANYPLFGVSQGNFFYSQMMKDNQHRYAGHLYHNQQNGTFTDVTAEANVQSLAQTLGVIAADFNQDGWTDLYLSNDFNVPDYLYLNNQDNTFREVIKESTGHTAMFGMGADAADFNNDGLVDLIQVDMTPSDHKRSKTNMASMSPETFYKSVELGFHYQYMQNTLQLNNGISPSGLPLFSDVSRITGLATTDWSWGALFADLDNDGFKDVFVTNGILRDVNNNDAIISFDRASFFGNKTDYTKLPSTPISNYAFQNKGDLSFDDKTAQWKLDEKGFSNGVAFGDLDNDGDLELIVNNINAPASIYNNLSPKAHHFLRIKLQGPQENPFGIGAKVSITHDDRFQYVDHTLTRGFQSSVETMVHFGLSNSDTVDYLEVTWPDGRKNRLSNVPADQVLEVNYRESAPTTGMRKRKPTPFTSSQNTDLLFTHTENEFNDFANEPLLPHKNSNLGPGSAVGDVNGDGLEDIFFGNAEGKVARLFTQTPSGQFEALYGPWENDSAYEDTGAILADLDGDSDLDLYVVSGGNNPAKAKSFYQDRLYYNQAGRFKKVDLPAIETSGKVVLPFDYDLDGDVDLFIGGRIIPGNYPIAPETMILENQGGSNDQMLFKPLNENKTGPLKNIGLVTAAHWENLDEDENRELIVTGEWMGIEIFKYQNDRFTNVTKTFGLDNMVGWWRSMIISDVDLDGDLDIIAGNLGLNYKYKASENSPFSIYANDFDNNGTSDIVLSYEKQGKKLPLRGRQCSSEQVPILAKRFETFEAFADASLEDIYGKDMLNNSTLYQANTFEHVWLENQQGKLVSHPLPRMAQISSIEAILPFDYNGDDLTDLLLAGNLYEAEVETTRNDASVGLVLEGLGKEGFRVIPPTESGLMVIGEVRSIHQIRTKQNHRLLLFTKNNSRPELWELMSTYISELHP